MQRDAPEVQQKGGREPGREQSLALGSQRLREVIARPDETLRSYHASRLATHSAQWSGPWCPGVHERAPRRRARLAHGAYSCGSAAAQGAERRGRDMGEAKIVVDEEAKN